MKWEASRTTFLISLSIRTAYPLGLHAQERLPLDARSDTLERLVGLDGPVVQVAPVRVGIYSSGIPNKAS